MNPLRDLYAAPLEEFVATRNNLSAELRARGDTELAASVAKLKKPSLPVWLANAVAREAPDAIRALFDAGQALKEALERGDPAEARRASEERRRSVTAAVAAAKKLAQDNGRAAPTKGMLDRLTRTFYLASTDEAAGARLEEACLAAEPVEAEEPVGFPEVTGTTTPRPTAASKRAQERAAALEAEAGALEQRATELLERARKQEREAAAARGAADRARQEAKDARKAADEAAAEI